MTQEKKQNIKMWALYVLFFLAVRLLQDGILNKLPIAGTVLNPLPMAAVCVSIWTGAEKGGLFALIMGLFCAQESGVYGGVLLFSLVCCALVGGWLCETVLNRRTLAAVLLCAMSLAFCLAVEFLFRAWMVGAHIGHFRIALRQIVLTLPLAPVLHLICRRIRKEGAQWTA